MKPIAVIQHQANEDEGFIYEWSQLHGLELVKWHVNKRDNFTAASNFGGVIVLGGEANVTDVEKLIWMKREISWIQSAIELSIPCFGICLGAQLLASMLNASVVPLIQVEQGIEPLYLSNKGVLADFNLRQLPVLQAHSYRFEIPESAANYAATEQCGQQLFIHNSGKIIGIQCHLEWSLRKYQQLFPDTISDEQGMVFSEDKAKHLLFYLLDRLFISRQF